VAVGLEGGGVKTPLACRWQPEAVGEPCVAWECRKHGFAWVGGRRAPGRAARARAPARGRPQGYENKNQCSA